MPAPQTDFSPGDLAHAPDPYALLADVRKLGPVVRGPGSWVVLGHTEALAVLRSPAARSGFIAGFYSALLPEGAAREEMRLRLNFLDPPDHTRVRKLVAKAFTPRRVEALRPYVAALASGLLAPLAERDRVDLVREFAHQVPSLVISELLGVPVDERDRLTELADHVSALLGLGGLDDAKKAAAIEAAEEMHTRLRALLQDRRREPADDLLSALLAAEDEGERLTESELLSLAATLYSAGHRTTRDLFCNGMATLLADAETLAAARSGSIPGAAVIEEFLRYETPTHYVVRMLEAPLELGAITIPAAEPVSVMLAAANRDPGVYERADRFEPQRWAHNPPPPSPLSFAFGPHFCIGASLARMEASVMLEALLASFPRMRACDEALVWRHSGVFRSLESLTIRPGN